MEGIGKKIKLLRHQRGWGQADAASRLGISVAAYSKIETSFTDINLSRLKQIAEMFDLTDVELLALGEPDEQTPGNDKLEAARLRLKDFDQQILDLRKRVIELFEELKLLKEVEN